MLAKSGYCARAFDHSSSGTDEAEVTKTIQTRLKLLRGREIPMNEVKRPIPLEMLAAQREELTGLLAGGSRSHDPHAEQAGCIPLLVGAAIMLFTLGGFGCWLSGVLYMNARQMLAKMLRTHIEGYLTTAGKFGTLVTNIVVQPRRH